MAVNIIVETRVDSSVIFEKSNPLLYAGEIAINSEGFQSAEKTGVKIGDGIHTWQELDYLKTTKEVVEKWYQIATTSTNAKLVTLPDMNFAYTSVNADTSPMIESIIQTTLRQSDFFEICEESIDNNDYGVLKLKASGVQDLLFLTNSSSDRLTNISRLNLTRNDEQGGESRDYYFWDENSHLLINSLELKLNTAEKEIDNLTDSIFNAENGIASQIEAKLIPFTHGGEAPGLVNPPHSDMDNNYFLNANNEWTKVPLYANSIPMSPDNDKTIAEAIQNALEAMVSISTLADTDEETNYVTTVKNTNDDSLRYATSVYIRKNVLHGAAWNDYAEYRNTIPEAKPGQVVVENGNGTLRISTKRLEAGCEIISDTFGFSIGESENCKTPIACSGRVLAYPYENRDTFIAGEPVCSGPNGTVSRMTREEAREYPERIIGTVSEIPNYNTWGEANVLVNGRIWIRVR